MEMKFNVRAIKVISKTQMITLYGFFGFLNNYTFQAKFLYRLLPVWKVFPACLIYLRRVKLAKLRMAILFVTVLKSIHWVNSSARSSFFEKGIILTKPFQPSQSWHQLSFFEKGIIVQNFLLSEWGLVITLLLSISTILNITWKL